MGEEKKHALLSASSAKRWLSCPPSARLCENYHDKGSSYAQEGTDAHELCEYKLLTALGEKVADPTAKLEYYNEEMNGHAEAYAEFILEIVHKAGQQNIIPKVYIEEKVDYSKWAQEGFGTTDCIIIANGVLHVIDFKYGAGVLVEAEDNTQMKLYALGALNKYEFIYDIKTVSMTIFQPRRDNVSTWTVPTDILYQWAEDTLKPVAELAYAGEGKFSCGDWCKFCKAKAECRARAERNMELAALDFKIPPLLEDDEIAAILGKLDALISWANTIKDFAFNKALKGKKWDGFKLVEGSSNRQISDKEAAEKALKNANCKPSAIYKPQELLGIGGLEKNLGKELFGEILGEFITKPPGKPALVPESDKRAEISVTSAYDDFADID